jgi:hypothetical protein
MPTVVFAAPLLSENATRMIEAVASLPDVRLGVDHTRPRGKTFALRSRREWMVTGV